MASKSSVAVCLATYNGHLYITELLESLERQSVDNFKIYIRDDGSTDETLPIISEFAASSRHEIIIISDCLGNLGPAKNFLRILSLTREEILFFCDQDDIWHIDKIKEITEKLTCAQSVPAAAYCNYDICFEETGRCENVRAAFFPPDLIYENQIPGCCIAINRPLADSLIRNRIDGVLHDWLAMLVNLAEDGLFIHVDKSLVLYRQHPNNVIGARTERSLPFAMWTGRRFLSTTRRNFRYLKALAISGDMNFQTYLRSRIAYKLTELLR